MNEQQEVVQVERPGWIYFAYAPLMHRVKIGFTQNTPDQRLASATDSPDVINVWGMLYGYREMEKRLHRRFRHLRIKGEWFAVDDTLRNFVQNHAYQECEQVTSTSWKDKSWACWERCATTPQWEDLKGLCQGDPVALCERWGDPLFYFYNCVKPLVVSWFGWEARFRNDDVLRSADAYDVVYDMCVDLLPC